MDISEIMWHVFQRTGHIGAYVTYKDFKRRQVSPEYKGKAEDKSFE